MNYLVTQMVRTYFGAMRINSRLCCYPLRFDTRAKADGQGSSCSATFRIVRSNLDYLCKPEIVKRDACRVRHFHHLEVHLQFVYSAMSPIQLLVSPKLPTTLENHTHVDLPGYDVWLFYVWRSSNEFLLLILASGQHSSCPSDTP